MFCTLPIDSLWEEEGRGAMTSGLLATRGTGHTSVVCTYQGVGGIVPSRPAYWLLTMFLTCTWQTTPELAQGVGWPCFVRLAGTLLAWHVG